VWSIYLMMMLQAVSGTAWAAYGLANPNPGLRGTLVAMRRMQSGAPPPGGVQATDYREDQGSAERKGVCIPSRSSGHGRP
jgi:hypothetical protein